LIRKDHILVRSGVSEWPDGTYSGSYAFRHILYQNIIYQNLPPGHRAQTHKRLGKRLEEAHAGRTPEIAPVLALHFEQGREFPNALRYLREAAESSTKRLGHAEAASYLTRALGILDRFDAADEFSARVALLRQRSWALRSCGDLVGSIRDLRDMIACAEYLIAQRYTRSERLGLLGGSAGGILVGRAMTERPDLFAAVVANVGALDMIRMEITPTGPGNVDEFGSVKTEAGFAALLEMSTYHHAQA